MLFEVRSARRLMVVRRRSASEVERREPKEGLVGSPIELEGVSRRYPVGNSAMTVLDRVDLTVDAGQLVVLGPSGSGKTTLLNLIGALDRLSDGEITLDGRRIAHASRNEFRVRRETVSFVFQTFPAAAGPATGSRARSRATARCVRVPVSGVPPRPPHRAPR